MKHYLPQNHTKGPFDSKGEKPNDPGRKFDLGEAFKQHNLDFYTSLEELSRAVAGFTGSGGYFFDQNKNSGFDSPLYYQDQEGKYFYWNQQSQDYLPVPPEYQFLGTYQPYSCNGPHHALIVAHFSSMVASEMLADAEMRKIINQQISSLPTNAQNFLTGDNHQNYKKIIEIMALLHDTGRPSDGNDQWDATNEINVITNIRHLLATTGLEAADQDAIMKLVEDGIKFSDGVFKDTNGKPVGEDEEHKGFLFGCPFGAGDSLHTGHAFRGGASWNQNLFNPEYVRLYQCFESFRAKFLAIAAEARKFVPDPAAQGNTALCAVKKYLALYPGGGFICSTGHNAEYDGPSVLKPSYAKDIEQEFRQLNADEFPIMEEYGVSRPYYTVKAELADGKSGRKVSHIRYNDTGKEFIIKYVPASQIVNAFLVSKFLKDVLEDYPLLINDQQLNFHTPEVCQFDQYFDQEYLPQLKPNSKNGRKLQGVASIDSIADAGKFAAIFQFLMLGDNIAHNIRISEGNKFSIFDFDSAFYLRGECLTSKEGIFCDTLKQSDTMFCNDFLDIIALRLGKDRYESVQTDQSYLPQFQDETWEIFFQGVRDGLVLIQEKIRINFIDKCITEITFKAKKSDHLARVKDIFQKRFANLQSNIAYINALLEGSAKIDGFDMTSRIAGYSPGDVLVGIDVLKQKMKRGYVKFVDKEKSEKLALKEQTKQMKTTFDQKKETYTDNPHKITKTQEILYEGKPNLYIYFANSQDAQNFAQYISTEMEINSSQGGQKTVYAEDSGEPYIVFTQENVDKFKAKEVPTKKQDEFKVPAKPKAPPAPNPTANPPQDVGSKDASIASLKFPSNTSKDAFLKLDQEQQNQILEGTQITITQEELAHSKRFLALVALTGGEQISSQKSQKLVYESQGILDANLLEGLTATSLEEKIDEISKKITQQNISNFYKRLVAKRPKTFYLQEDYYLLRDEKTKGKGCPGDQNPEEYLLYCEMEISAMLQIVGPTHFINNGNRYNKGVKSDEADYEASGRISAIVGARLEISDGMEALHLVGGNMTKALQASSIGRIKDVSQDFIAGYKIIWDKFYCDNKTDALAAKAIDPKALEYRLYISYKKFIADAIDNATKEDKLAYIRIVGLGDGSWGGFFKEQISQAIGLAVARIVNELKPDQKAKIAAIEFCQFKHQKYFDAFQTKINAEKDVKIISSQDGKFAHKIDAEPQNCRLSVNFAFDGGSFVGNEYWSEKLTASGDPAAACCSSIVVSMNPEINPKFLDRLMVVDEEYKTIDLSSAFAAQEPKKTGLQPVDSSDDDEPEPNEPDNPAKQENDMAELKRKIQIRENQIQGLAKLDSFEIAENFESLTAKLKTLNEWKATTERNSNIKITPPSSSPEKPEAETIKSPYLIIPPSTFRSIFSDTERNNNMRVLSDLYKTESQTIDVEKIKNALKATIILSAQKNNFLDKDQFRLILEFARENGGFSNKFNKEKNQYTKLGTELLDFIIKNKVVFKIEETETAKIEAAAKIIEKNIKKFSRDIQVKNNEIGIYSGRKGLKQAPSLRSTFALDVVGDELLADFDNAIKSTEHQNLHIQLSSECKQNFDRAKD